MNLRFSHRNVYGEDQVRLRFTAFGQTTLQQAIFGTIKIILATLMDEAILANLNGNFSHMLIQGHNSSSNAYLL